MMHSTNLGEGGKLAMGLELCLSVLERRDLYAVIACVDKFLFPFLPTIDDTKLMLVVSAIIFDSTVLKLLPY